MNQAISKKQITTYKFSKTLFVMGITHYVYTPYRLYNINYQKYSLVFQTQISKSQDDYIWILFRPVLYQIVCIHLLNYCETSGCVA